MKTPSKRRLIYSIGLGTMLFLLAGCGGSPIPAPRPTPSPNRTPAGTAAQTPSGLGQSVVYQNVEITVIAYEFSDAYIPRVRPDQTVPPPAGAKFLWLHMMAVNAGQERLALPGPDSFEILYRGTASRSITMNYSFATRSGYRDYAGGIVSPAISDEGWVAFVAPSGASASDVIVRANLDSKLVAPVYFLCRLGSP